MSAKRNVYLHMTSLPQARRIVFNAFEKDLETGRERIDSVAAAGRVLAEPVTAALSSPNFHAAAMDGVAVEARDTFGAHETRPKQLIVGRQAFFVNTGHPLPPGTDAVIMIEHVQLFGDSEVRIEAPAFPWQHVRKMGEDIVATEMLFARSHLLTPYCVGALLSAGVFQVVVHRRPKVLLLPTGGELVDWRDVTPRTLAPGQVIESNAYVLGGLVEAVGGVPVRHQLVRDNTDAIKTVVGDVLSQDFDMVLILGGSSAGSEDFARAVIDDLGEVLVHGVTMMPGKPVIVGRIGGKPVFGIPGYPVSAIMAFEQLVQPLLARMQKRPEPRRDVVEATPTRKLASRLGVEEFVRVRLGQVGDKLVATPLPRGAGCITSITEADGIIRIPSHVEGLRENATAMTELLRPRHVIGNTVIAVGSHDNTLDILADELRAREAAFSFSSNHVGSIGGLMAVKRGVCHLAGVHLLDEATGVYNVGHIKKTLGDTPVRLVHLVMREQGLMTPRGNPKRIKGVEDLVRDDVRLVNRQAGSGTRILLDYQLRRLGLAPGQIAGYDNEEFTHMAVAVAVLSGAADVGLGIFAAARALGLEFTPVVTEQYDLVIPDVFFESPAIQALLAVVSSPVFRDRVAALGGYHTDRTGEVLM